MSLTAIVNLMNQAKPDTVVHLKVTGYAAMTYGANLRIGVTGEDPHTELRGTVEQVLVRPVDLGQKLWLNLWHGRANPNDSMDEWGYSADTVEGHVPPRGDVIIFSKEGAKVINYHATGDGWDEQLIPYVDDMLHFEGHFYGDWSADNDGKVG